jgi:hypothetical protein
LGKQIKLIKTPIVGRFLRLKEGIREMKKIRLLSLLFVSALFVQNAAAALLPYSSYYQGRSYFSDADAGITGHVDFAVYDTWSAYGNEWVGADFTAPGNGRYIYAYQVFNDSASTTAIGAFTIMGLGGIPHILVGIDTMTSQNPWERFPLITEGVEPNGTSVNIGDPNSSIPTQATWKFWGPTGALLVADEYSWFLIFSSDNYWVRGQYRVQPEGGFPITSNPEPATLALLGAGGAILLTKRKKPS